MHNIPLFFIFGMYVSQRRFYADYVKTGEMNNYIFTINTFLVIINAFIFIILISPVGSYILNLLLDFKKVPYAIVMIALIIGFLRIFNQMGDIYYRTVYALKRIAFANIIGFILSNAAAIFLIVFMQKGVMGKYMGMLLSTIFVFVILYIPYIRKSGKSFRKKYLKISLLMGIPIMINSVTHVIINYSDRIVIAKYLPIDIVGIYSIAYMGGLLLTVFIGAFNTAWIPMFNELMNSEKFNRYDIVKKRFTEFAIILVFLCIAGQLFGINVINLLLPIEYAKASIFLPYILFGIVFFGFNHFLTNIIVYHKDTYFLPVLTGISATVNLGLNILFIPRFGPIVAAYTTIIAYAIISIAMLIIIKIKYKSYQFNYIKILLILLFSFNPLILHLAGNDDLLYIVFKLTYLTVFTLIFMHNIRNIVNIWKKDKRKAK